MEQQDISVAQFQAVLQAAPDLAHIELQGEGESLMHPHFFEMAQAARARGIKVSLISNGSYLNPQSVRQLLDLGIEKISISLESAESETFRRIRGGKLEKVVRGVTELMAQRRARGASKPVVAFSITVLKETQEHLEGILRLYQELGLDGGITLQPLQTMPTYVQNYPETLRQQLLSHEEVNDLWVQFYAHRGIRKIQRDKLRTGVQGFFDELMGGFHAGKRSCPWLEQGLYVNNQGQASACCMIKDTQTYGLGRVGADSMEQILNKREQLRTELAQGQIPKPCQGCELARFATMTRGQLLLFGMRGMWRRMSPKRLWRQLRRRGNKTLPPSGPQGRLPAGTPEDAQRPRVSLPLAQ